MAPGPGGAILGPCFISMMQLDCSAVNSIKTPAAFECHVLKKSRWTSSRGLMFDARMQTGGREPKERPGQGTDQPGGDESADKLRD